MPLREIALGRYNELMDPEPLKAAFAELVATFLFVFIGEGSSIAFIVVSGSSILTPIGLLVAAICHGFAIYVAIANAYHVSGGHVNPAVTVGLLVGGYITVLKGILYIVMQLVGAALASLLLKYVTNDVAMPVHAVGGGDDITQALVLEIVMTFLLLFTIYARAVDPRAKETSSSMPLTVGLLVVALILCGGPFSSCSMNPARSFGPALVAWTWAGHWIYWVGPILGGALAGVLYELIYIETSNLTGHERLPSTEDY
ncbi:hypothetical protein KP509_35G014200 [Ceratopteris richardii]|uniref:Aquaporin n=1 Tax=Ceratopteris richardii TaxID=49495 RepID=A0A8T2QEK7_CERRI|nr:hypothetical protein KP509_35G014200 [Ceratopteris richardii]